MDLFSTDPARSFGLYRRKGAIAVGSDADFAIWNTRVKRTLAMADLHHDGDYSPWEGWEIGALPVVTLLRGRPIVRHGTLLGTPADGRWLSRRIDAGILESSGLS